METPLDKINKIASKDQSTWLDDAQERQAKKNWTQRSFKIAIRILREIRAQKPINGMTQKKLAALMGVSPQYINKVVKGKENLTLETISKIEQILGITLVNIPSSETKGTISAVHTEFKGVIDRNLSKTISENVWSYDYTQYYKRTGTYG